MGDVEPNKIHAVCANCQTVGSKEEIKFHYMERLCFECRRAFNKGVSYTYHAQSLGMKVNPYTDE